MNYVWREAFFLACNCEVYLKNLMLYAYTIEVLYELYELLKYI